LQIFGYLPDVDMIWQCSFWWLKTRENPETHQVGPC